MEKQHRLSKLTYLLCVIFLLCLNACGSGASDGSTETAENDDYRELKSIKISDTKTEKNFIFSKGRAYRVRAKDAKTEVTSIQIMKGQQKVKETKGSSLLFECSQTGRHIILIQSKKSSGTVLLEMKTK